MPRETNAAKRERAIEVCERLNRRYGPVECFLDHENPFRLLIAVLLSAQTTDAQVNKVTPRLFAQWPTPEAMAGASVADVADTIKSLGFYKSKAKHAVEAAQMIVADYDGEVPADMKELVKLPGVGRKTANIVLAIAAGLVIIGLQVLPFSPAALKPASWVIVVVWIVLGLALRLMSLRSRRE